MSSSQSATDSEDLRRRFERLLLEAEESGSLGELGDLWDQAQSRHVEACAQLEPGPAVVFPGRFGMVGDSPQMHALFDLIERVAKSDVSVLIHGETGTGKELVAQALHRASARAKGPFVAENCAAVPASLLESELFGHKRGAFTGAVADRDGRFLSADKGTLFLDEIGDMPLVMQAKLLRVLEEREIRPVGGDRTIPVDARVLAASHRDLEVMVKERSFREDLLYRLNVIRLDLPPLRERPGDVVLLSRFFADLLAKKMGRSAVEFAPEALEALAAAPWPGNVRQLENEIMKTMAMSGGRISVEDLSTDLRT